MNKRNGRDNGRKPAARDAAPPIGAADALFAALADLKTAAFIRSVFSRPDERPAVTTEKTPCRLGRKRFWEVAIIEKPPWPPLRRPLLNVAHILVDAEDGRVRERWFLTKVRDDEYRDFLRTRPARPGGCRDRNP